MVALILNPSGSFEEAINPLTIVVLPAPEGAEKIIALPFPLGANPVGIFKVRLKLVL